MFVVADATLVPVLITLCFAARALFVAFVVAARLRTIGGDDDCIIALSREEIERDKLFVVEERDSVLVAVRAVSTVRVAANTSDAHIKIANNKDVFFKNFPSAFWRIIS